VIVQESEEDDKEPKPKPKAKAKPKTKAKVIVEESEEDDEEPKAKPNAKAKVVKEESENDDEESDSKPKAKAKPKARVKVVKEDSDDEPKPKKDDTNDKMQKECINDLKKIYTTMKRINLICTDTFDTADRLSVYNKLDLVKLSKEDRITFFNKIGSILYKLLTLNYENSIEKQNIDFMGEYDKNIFNMVNVCLNYIGRYCYDINTDLMNIVDTYINENINNRNAKIYSIHTDTLYISENNYIFKGILVVLNEIIERNYLNNENKNKNIIIPMFMMIIKEKIMKQIKYLNTNKYENDKLLKHYMNFKNILMNPVMFEKIIMKLNDVK
jgi:hypothetical protein